MSRTMEMPKGVEWTAHSLVVLEVIGDQRPVSSAVLATIFDLSPSYLHKQLQKLVSHDVMTSVPGPTGGFVLARPASEITLADVVAALSGPAPVFRCTEIRCRGVFADREQEIRAGGLCGINAAMLHAEAAWRASLTVVTIAALAAGVPDRDRNAMLHAAGVETSTEKGNRR